MIPQLHHPSEASGAQPPATAGWRIIVMIGLYLLSLGVVGVTAFVGAARWYVAGFAHLPVWIGSGLLALIVGTYAAVWLAQH